MTDVWKGLENLNKKTTLIRSFIAVICVAFGMVLNATYDLIDWIKLPYSNKRDIVILLEKSQEFSNVVSSIEELREAMDENNLNVLELQGKIEKLEDGQLRLFLNVERLDERTKKM